MVGSWTGLGRPGAELDSLSAEGFSSLPDPAGQTPAKRIGGPPEVTSSVGLAEPARCGADSGQALAAENFSLRRKYASIPKYTRTSRSKSPSPHLILRLEGGPPSPSACRGPLRGGFAPAADVTSRRPRPLRAAQTPIGSVMQQVVSTVVLRICVLV